MYTGSTHLEEEEVHPELLRDDEHDELVRSRAEEEREHHRAELAQPETRHRGRIHVAQQEGVHRAVPLARELVPGRGVPPVVIEAAVGETVHMRARARVSVAARDCRGRKGDSLGELGEAVADTLCGWADEPGARDDGLVVSRTEDKVEEQEQGDHERQREVQDRTPHRRPRRGQLWDDETLGDSVQQRERAERRHRLLEDVQRANPGDTVIQKAHRRTKDQGLTYLSAGTRARIRASG